MTKVNVDDLRNFLALCVSQNMRSTAGQLGVSQSAISRSLGRLEAELGVLLFTRSGRHLRVNRFGRMYRPHAQRMVDELEAGARRLRLGAKRTSHIRVGFPHGSGQWLIERLLGKIETRRTGALFELREGTSRQIAAWLADDLVDVALMLEPEPGYECEWLALPTQALRVALPPGHRLGTFTSIPLGELAGEPRVSFRSGTDIRAVVDEALARASATTEVVLESNDLTTLRTAVSAGVGLALLPDWLASGSSDLLMLPTDPERTWSWGLASRGRTPRTAEIASLLQQGRRMRTGR